MFIPAFFMPFLYLKKHNSKINIFGVWGIKERMILGVSMKDARLMAALKLTSRALTFMVGLCSTENLILN
jgi:hypothetical protein